ncbi:MAG: magnesium/cobalt transporter CorA [Lutibacter sp.]|nr:magnesium/cobalt transporter CorA [Lutibacter sp.]MDP3945177.1 magnesium/cobalt transporter CorA [Lutibacter sp.]
MARYLKTKKEHIGLSPYEIHFKGEKKSEKVILEVIDYDSENLDEFIAKDLNEVVKFNKTATTTWLNIYGLHDIKIMNDIAMQFELDSLILADIMNTHARPKIQEYDNCIYISFKMLQYDEKRNYISSENIVIIIKEHILLLFQEKIGDVFDPIRDRMRKNKRRIRSSRTDYLAFALMDIVFDNYNYIISQIGEKIEALEIHLLNNAKESTLKEINNFKKEIIYLNKSIKPCREIVVELLKLDSELLDDNVYVNFEDLQNNVNQATESLESYREILSDQLQVYHTTISSKLNDIIKFLTVFSVIFIPLTFIAGVYGTNFDYLPELHYKYSYFIMLGVMLVLAISMIVYFKKKKWF